VRNTTFDPYRVLQVAPDAKDTDIAAAYRALARRHHPDRAGEAATPAMARINRAWEMIGTSAARAAHDAERRPLVATGPGRPAAEPVDHTRSWFEPEPDGTGAAGPPPGRPFGSVLPFGRHIGWSLGEIARVDVGYLEWLEDRREGRPFREEIDVLLRRIGRRPADDPAGDVPQRGFLRRTRV
jgi:curved DNA-binding protein CbpA